MLYLFFLYDLALGFYSVTPGSSNYALGSPLVKEAMITFPNGKTTKIVARNQSILSKPLLDYKSFKIVMHPSVIQNVNLKNVSSRSKLI
ncbi:MAG: glycoside hydrolase family 92 protein [Bacteroidetes bacterium]|nr:glycoside hydrolase family 92 protein [Bacteroidota bacterium]